jgi:hypothetical protein
MPLKSILLKATVRCHTGLLVRFFPKVVSLEGKGECCLASKPKKFLRF